MSEYFLHPLGVCESKQIGSGTRVWAFAHVLPGARIGADCNLCDHTFVENDVIVGDRVTIKCGVQLWDGVRLADDVFVGPNATFTNDLFPRSRERPERFLETRVERGASIGANATILAGITIGERAMIGAGSVVTRSIPPYAIVRGNPARIVGYVDSQSGAALKAASNELAPLGASQSGVKGVALHTLKHVKDLRGDLAVANFGPEVPFTPKRFFMVFDVPSKEVRGEHAHRRCAQFLICARGSVAVMVDDGQTRAEYVLDRPSLGLHMPPMTWGTQYKYSADACLLVFASEAYDPGDYIRTYGEFIELVRSRARG